MKVTFDLSGFADLGGNFAWSETELLRNGGEDLAARPDILIGKRSFTAEVSAASNGAQQRGGLQLDVGGAYLRVDRLDPTLH